MNIMNYRTTPFMMLAALFALTVTATVTAAEQPGKVFTHPDGFSFTLPDGWTFAKWGDYYRLVPDRSDRAEAPAMSMLLVSKPAGDIEDLNSPNLRRLFEPDFKQRWPFLKAVGSLEPAKMQQGVGALGHWAGLHPKGLPMGADVYMTLAHGRGIGLMAVGLKSSIAQSGQLLSSVFATFSADTPAAPHPGLIPSGPDAQQGEAHVKIGPSSSLRNWIAFDVKEDRSGSRLELTLAQEPPDSDDVFDVNEILEDASRVFDQFIMVHLPGFEANGADGLVFAGYATSCEPQFTEGAAPQLTLRGATPPDSDPPSYYPPSDPIEIGSHGLRFWTHQGPDGLIRGGEGDVPGNSLIRYRGLIRIAGAGNTFSREYRILSARHTIDSTGGHKTYIVFAQPSVGVARPPTEQMPQLGAVYTARVLGRDDYDATMVRVQLNWSPEGGPGSHEMSARVSSLFASSEAGAWFLPELDDEVLVTFEAGDVTRPIIIGSLWPQYDNDILVEELGDAPDKNYAIVTRQNARIQVTEGDDKTTMTLRTDNGNKLIIRESSGQDDKVMLETTEGRRIVLSDGADSILVRNNTGQEIVINDDGITIKSGGAIKLQSSNKITLKASELKVDAATAHFGHLNADTINTGSIASGSYSPAAGNVF